ncbi:MAG TPA: IS256 family transposase [Candidatus Dormibacteraeota bacterium]|nr:IS256 family transposase [Candidatus Dormibacteraeota bacterium]
MNKRVAPSVELEAAIERLLAERLTDSERLAEIGRLGARLALQRAIEEEVDAFLGRTRYERKPEALGWRNGNRPKRVQTAEGELEIQLPQIRCAAEQFVSSVIPNGRTALRTRPLEALIIGAWVRGLSDRDIESLVEEAGLGQLSKTAVCETTKELRARYRAFRARSLGDVELLVLFLDAIYLPTRPSGAKEGVLVAWGYDETGHRVLLDVVLGQRERFEDWLEMGRGLVRRGLRAPMLVVTDGAPADPGDGGAVAGQRPPEVHRLWNLVAKLPKKDVELRERIEAAYWAALDEATSPADGEARLRQLVTDLERSYPSAAACLAEDLPALCVHLAYPLRLRKRLRSTNLLERSLEEVKRRTKVIGRFPGETSCLSLCWAVLDLFMGSARGLALTALEHRQLAQMRAVRMAQAPDSLTA